MLTMRDGRTNNKQGKIGLLSQWKLEAEFRNIYPKAGGDENNKIKYKFYDIEGPLVDGP